jgi:hypothetical protein
MEARRLIDHADLAAALIDRRGDHAVALGEQPHRAADQLACGIVRANACRPRAGAR